MVSDASAALTAARTSSTPAAAMAATRSPSNGFFTSIVGARRIHSPPMKRPNASVALTVTSTSPEAVHRTGVQQLVDREEAVALHDITILHDELHVPHGVHILERVAGHADEISIKPRLDRPALILEDVGGFEAIDRERLQSVLHGDAGGLPREQEVDRQIAPVQPLPLLVFHLVVPIVHVGREGDRYFLLPRRPKLIGRMFLPLLG